MIDIDLDPTIPARFWSKVQKADTCWFWTGARTAKGYGLLKPNLYAHRLAYEFAYGPIPKGKCVLHHCDCRHCVNPEHLWIGTKGDNNRDMIAKGRYRGGTNGYHGEAHTNSKLTSQQVQEMRQSYRFGSRGYGTYALARKYGVSQHLIYLIVTHKSWRHLP